MHKKYNLSLYSKNISKQIIHLAIPIIFSNLSRVIMGLADIAMVSRLGANALAATGMGSLILWIVLSIGIGLRTGVQTVSSRRLGQQNYSECSNALYNGIIIAISISIPFTIFAIVYLNEICNIFLSDPNVIKLCTDYMYIGSFSIIFVLISFAFQGFYASIEETKVHMVVTICSNILNIYLNAGLIYGTVKLSNYFTDIGLPWISVLWKWIYFPSMGVKGAASATLIASIWMLIHYLYFLFKPKIQKFKPFKYILNLKKIIQQLQLGLPVGIQEMLTMVGFSIFYKIIGIIGTLELAASHVVLNIAHASFMPAVGIGMSASTLIGKYLGKEEYVNAEKTVKEAVKWSFLIMGTGGLIFIFLPEIVVPIFTNDLQIIKLSIPCLKIVGVLQFFDAIGLTLFFVLTGAGNTSFPAFVNMLICWFIFLPLTYILTIKLNMGIIGAWLGFSGWIVPFAIIMAIKVKNGSWKYIKV